MTDTVRVVQSQESRMMEFVSWHRCYHCQSLVHHTIFPINRDMSIASRTDQTMEEIIEISQRP